MVLPPLRERGTDIILLANQFLKLFCAQHAGRPKSLAERTKELLLAWSWPGNFRELRNAIQKAVLLPEVDLIMPSDISVGVRSHTTLESHALSGHTQITLTLDPLNCSLEDIERWVIISVLELTDWNKSRA